MLVILYRVLFWLSLGGVSGVMVSAAIGIIMFLRRPDNGRTRGTTHGFD